MGENEHRPGEKFFFFKFFFCRGFWLVSRDVVVISGGSRVWAARMSMTVGQFVISKLGVKSWIAKTSTTTSPASHSKKRRSLYSFINGEQMKRGSRASSLSAAIGCVIHPTQLAANALPSAYDLSTDFLRGCGSLANNHSGWNSAIPAWKPFDFGPTDLQWSILSNQKPSDFKERTYDTYVLKVFWEIETGEGSISYCQRVQAGSPSNHSSMSPCTYNRYRYLPVFTAVIT